MAGPLAGVCVLDFSTLLPGPFATLWLADLGADVVRLVAPSAARDSPVGLDPAVASALNRNKRSLALDLKHAGSRPVVERLVRRSDVLVEQFRPGVLAGLGWGYAEARAVNPAIVYCSLTGYGQSGPYARRAGHDINYLALAGVLSYSGRRDQVPPPNGIQIADLVGGLTAAAGILAALHRRTATGTGEHVDVSMFDASVALNVLAGSTFLAGGRVAKPESELLNGGTLYDCYRTKDGRFLSVGSLEPKFAAALFTVLGRPELAHAGRLADSGSTAGLKQWMTDAIAERTLAEWQDVFAAVDACVEPVLSLDEALAHPQAVARGLAVDVPAEDGSVRQLAHPVRFSGGGAEYRHAGRPDGSDADSVLREAGFDDGQRAQLRRDGVVR